jgi:hypothetical protein
LEKRLVDSSSRLRLAKSVALFCPEIPRNIRATWLNTSFGINKLDDDLKHPVETIARELRIAFRAIAASDCALSDNAFWRRKCRELLLRPAVEPLILANWKKLTSFEMTEPELANFCSLLCASKQRARTNDSYGLWEDADVRFEPAEKAISWWNDIRTVADRPGLYALLPAYCFARTVMAHPYPDGNGRLARALVHAALARITNYKAPVLPLAPAFYMNGAKIAAALRRLSNTGDWEDFNEVIQEVLSCASRMSQLVAP